MLSKRGQALFFYAHFYDLKVSKGFQGSPDMLPPEALYGRRRCLLRHMDAIPEK